MDMNMMNGSSVNGIDKNGWYNVDLYRNNGGYYLGGDYVTDNTFGTTGNTREYKLVNGEWIITHKGSDWIS